MDTKVRTTIEVNLERKYFKKELVSDGYDSEERTEECQQLESNLVGSKTNVDDTHLLVLDLDFPCILVPSSTNGHFHLYLQKPMPWPKAKKLLVAMQEADLLEPMWVSQCLDEGMTSVRPPWAKKEQKIV